MKSTLLVVAVLAVTLTGCSDAPKTSSQAGGAKAAHPEAEAESELEGAQAESELARDQAESKSARDPAEPRKQNLQRGKKAKNRSNATTRTEKAAQEQKRKKALENALANAKVLEAPPFGSTKAKGTRGDLEEFTPKMRHLAEDEFAFKDAKSGVYRATFDQRSVDYSQVIEFTSGRNTLLFPGKYDFDGKKFECQFHLWYEHQGIPKANGGLFREYTNSCALVSTLSVDEATARRWRDAFEQGSMKLTIWFRLVAVERASWEQNPSFLDGSILQHDIIFRVEVLRFE